MKNLKIYLQSEILVIGFIFLLSGIFLSLCFINFSAVKTIIFSLAGIYFFILGIKQVLKLIFSRCKLTILLYKEAIKRMGKEDILLERDLEAWESNTFN